MWGICYSIRCFCCCSFLFVSTSTFCSLSSRTIFLPRNLFLLHGLFFFIASFSSESHFPYLLFFCMYSLFFLHNFFFFGASPFLKSFLPHELSFLCSSPCYDYLRLIACLLGSRAWAACGLRIYTSWNCEIWLSMLDLWFSLLLILTTVDEIPHDWSSSSSPLSDRRKTMLGMRAIQEREHSWGK